MNLYKFRSVAGDSFKFTQDIFVNRRLYLPQASSLNDPNEGVGTVQINNEYRAWGNQILERNRRNEIRLCSFSQSYRSNVLWAHYANEHKGICIEIDTGRLPPRSGIFRQVTYTDVTPTIPHNAQFDLREAFLNKTPEWAYEEEWRYISDDKSSSLLIGDEAISRVLVGAKFSEADMNWLVFWLDYYCSTRRVPIVKMKFAFNDYRLYEEHELIGKATARDC